MQTQLLKRFAPNSLQLLFFPTDTGSPNYDFNQHLDQFANRRADTTDDQGRQLRRYTGNLTRIDLETIQVIGGRVLGRVESTLGPVDDEEQRYKILTVPYAETQLENNNSDAVEFVRVIKEAVSAGVEADPRSLQIWASWGYSEIKLRYAHVLRNNPTRDAEILAEFKNTIIRDVLTEISRVAMELTAITATNEDRLLDEPETIELLPTRNQRLSARESKELFELRCEEILSNYEPEGAFAAELKSICSKLSPAHASGVVYDEEAQFQSHLSDVATDGQSRDENIEALQASHERVTEQYTEGGVVSLHMSDSERFIVEGTLDEDVSIEYLPVEARCIVPAIQRQFAAGVKVFSNNEKENTLDTFIEKELDFLYGNPKDKAARVTRTMREVRFVKGQRAPIEFTYRQSVYPAREERQYVREILDVLIETMQRDFILRNMNRSSTFRAFYNAIAEANDVRTLIAIIQEAFQARKVSTINIKMFTTLNTLYGVKRARLESTAVRITKEIDGKLRTFMPGIPVIEIAKRIPARELRTLAIAMHTLPRQEQERICRLLRDNRPALYTAIFDGLLDIINTASQAKRMYLRGAIYKNQKTGRPNQPHNMIHLLTQDDTAALWRRLIELSGVAEPIAA